MVMLFKLFLFTQLHLIHYPAIQYLRVCVYQTQLCDFSTLVIVILVELNKCFVFSGMRGHSMAIVSLI
jgi:hypothetical protein